MVKIRGPNILITGTPGVGKSFLSQHLANTAKLEWLNIGAIAEEHKCYEEYDEEFSCHVLDEDKIIDVLEPKIQVGGCIVDYHGADFFPKRWFDIVFVLRAATDKLYDRLAERGYKGKKLEKNMECEIMNTLLIEAKEAYDEDIVHELQSNTKDEFQSNVSRILQWIENWKADNIS